MINYEFIGWCKEDKHDKVWGLIRLSDTPKNRYTEQCDYLTVWGRRGAKLQTKMFKEIPYKVESLIRSKRGKGYKQIERYELDAVYPEFQTDLEKTAFWSTLKL